MILLGVPVLAGAFLLVEAGLEHIRAPKALARAAGTGMAAARAIAAVEFLVGVPSAAAVVFGTAELRWALATQTVMYIRRPPVVTPPPAGHLELRLQPDGHSGGSRLDHPSRGTGGRRAGSMSVLTAAVVLAWAPPRTLDAICKQLHYSGGYVHSYAS